MDAVMCPPVAVDVLGKKNQLLSRGDMKSEVGHNLVGVPQNSTWGAGKGRCGGTWFIAAVTITASVWHG